jgi:type IV pilus assembly protein PilC
VLLSSRLSVANLIELCRSMRYALMSGMMLRDTMELLATKGDPAVRRVAQQVARDLKAGWGLQEALEKQKGVFPPMFVAMATVGEEAGRLPEVMAELEKYYAMQQKLRRDLISEISWPVIQLVAAILIISGLIYILGIIQVTTGPGVEPIDPLGLGLLGPRGAIIFLGLVSGTLLGAWLVFWLTRKLLSRQAFVERVLLLIPVLGPTLRALALTRFCIALHILLDTSISVVKSFRLALVATDNAAFAAAAPGIEASLRRGNSITTALTESRVFPQSFLSTVAVAEESGRLSEVMRLQAEQYEDLARRRLTTLNKALSGLIWMLIAGVIILAIYRIFTQAYLKNIEKYLPH